MSVPRVGAAAPSGIPVASTESIRVTGLGLNNRLFPKTNDVPFAGGVGYYNSSYEGQVIRFDGIWKLQDFYYFDESLTITDEATNPSTDPNYIPTTGWSPRLDQPLGGSPAITTITAAPSGIVAATAGDLTIDFGYWSGGGYSKLSNTYWVMGGEAHQLTWNTDIANTWVLDAGNGEIRATNPSSDSTIIPTSGWTYTIGSGPAITITAA